MLLLLLQSSGALPATPLPDGLTSSIQLDLTNPFAGVLSSVVVASTGPFSVDPSRATFNR